MSRRVGIRGRGRRCLERICINEVHDSDAKGSRETLKIEVAGIACASFDISDVSAMEIRKLGELLLAQAPVASELPHSFSQCFQ